jgi:hypothetical protein
MENLNVITEEIPQNFCAMCTFPNLFNSVIEVSYHFAGPIGVRMLFMTVFVQVAHSIRVNDINLHLIRHNS